MACSTGDACGFTDTRSSARSSLNQSAVIRLTIDALDAWWPPTFTPERFSRTRLAWWTIAAESHSTRRSMALSVSRSGVAGGGDGVLGVELERALHVTGVPPLGQLPDYVDVLGHMGESGPGTHLRSSSPGVPAGRRLRPGWSAAHERYRLRLLPPGSDLVRERSPRGTRPSTPLSGVLAPKAKPLGWEFSPARAACG